MLKVLIGYLIMGLLITLVIYQREEEDTDREFISGAVITIVGWPLVVFLTILEIFNWK